jgi:hypothetical protein
MSQNRSPKKFSHNDPFLQQFFARIPTETAATFTNEQLTELKKVFSGRLFKGHAVDIRLSIPFLMKRFYIVFILGKEKRSKKRESM